MPTACPWVRSDHPHISTTTLTREDMLVFCPVKSKPLPAKPAPFLQNLLFSLQNLRFLTNSALFLPGPSEIVATVDDSALQANSGRYTASDAKPRLCSAWNSLWNTMTHNPMGLPKRSTFGGRSAPWARALAPRVRRYAK